MKTRFSTLLREVGANMSQADTAWSQLSSLYLEEGRAYHNLTHIAHMLELMDRHLLDDEQSVELQLAIWYHDVIYDPKSKENELKSAELCKKVLQEISSLNQERIEKVYLLIMSTQGHSPRIKGEENLLMLDLDLSILGAEKERYELYSKQIREEYYFYSEEDYRKGRCQVLGNFLDRKTIYFSELFQG
ncbi:MAG: hypothetical protein AAF696_30850, partial [Bacteroidota bacterium]